MYIVCLFPNFCHFDIHLISGGFTINMFYVEDIFFDDRTYKLKIIQKKFTYSKRFLTSFCLCQKNFIASLVDTHLSQEALVV